MLKSDKMCNLFIQKRQFGFEQKQRILMMKSMREKIQAAKPKLITYHCQPHLLNLLAKDLQEMQQSSVNKIIAVLKYFRNKHAAIAELSSNNLNKPPLPCETRWNTLRDSLQYFCTHWASLVRIIETLESEQNPERRNLESVQLRRAASELFQVFDVIAEALNMLQSDSSTIATATECWISVVDKISGMNNEQILAAANKRKSEALNNDCFLAANLVGNRYKGKKLSPEQLSSAADFLVNEDGSIQEDVTQFIAETGPYGNKSIKSDTDPTTYWKAGRRFAFNPSLCDIALRLTSAVCSSAGLERQFSTLKLTYGSLRTHFSKHVFLIVNICMKINFWNLIQ